MFPLYNHMPLNVTPHTPHPSVPHRNIWKLYFSILGVVLLQSAQGLWRTCELPKLLHFEQFNLDLFVIRIRI